METFGRWAAEKRVPLNELGLVAGTVAVGGMAYYLWQKGAARREKKAPFMVYKKDTKEQKAFSGVDVVKMLRTNFLKPDDMIYPPEAQNWMKISDARSFLPHEETTKGKVRDDTIWWAYINKKMVKYNSSEEFAKAIAKRDIEADTKVTRNGYEGWKPYKDPDVQEEIGPWVMKQPPSLGNQDNIGKKAWYIVGDRKTGPVKFEDLAKLVANGTIHDNNYVYVKKAYGDKWVRLKEIKKDLPSLGQAHAVQGHGIIGKIGKFIHFARHRDLIPGADTNDDTYVQLADIDDRDFEYGIEAIADDAKFREVESHFASDPLAKAAKQVVTSLFSKKTNYILDSVKGLRTAITISLLRKYNKRAKVEKQTPSEDGFKEWMTGGTGRGLLQQYLKEVEPILMDVHKASEKSKIEKLLVSGREIVETLKTTAAFLGKDKIMTLLDEYLKILEKGDIDDAQDRIEEIFRDINQIFADAGLAGLRKPG